MKERERELELWAVDEHRVGLQPILRRVWAPRGERPRVEVRPRYEWLYVVGFVRPKTGETDFWLCSAINSEVFARVVERFQEGRSQPVMLVLDQAGWHVSERTRQLQEDGSVELVYLPPYSPELQPAERLWKLIDEPLANRVFDRLADLEEAIAERCSELSDETGRLRSLTLYHWWPGGADHAHTT